MERQPVLSENFIKFVIGTLRARRPTPRRRSVPRYQPNKIDNMKKYPKIGIRPTIDGRQGGVRESLEDKTMALARAVGGGAWV